MIDKVFTEFFPDEHKLHQVLSAIIAHFQEQAASDGRCQAGWTRSFHYNEHVHVWLKERYGPEYSRAHVSHCARTSSFLGKREVYYLLAADLYWIDGGQVGPEPLSRRRRRARNRSRALEGLLPVVLHHCNSCCCLCKTKYFAEGYRHEHRGPHPRFSVCQSAPKFIASAERATELNLR